MIKNKKKIYGIIITAIIISILFSNVINAGVTDSDDLNNKVERKTTTNYFTTVKLEGTFYNETTNETLTFNKVAEEIEGNVEDGPITEIVDNFKDEFNTWANQNGATRIDDANEEISDYYYDAHDEITQENNGSDVILVGDINDLDNAYGKITINTILNKHQTYTIKIKATKEEVKEKNYLLTNNNFSASFSYEEGHDFQLTVLNVLAMSIDEINAMLDPEDAIDDNTYNTILDTVKNNTKEQGNLLALYAIEVNDSTMGYTGSIKLKIKLSEEMKKYNSFKLVYLDDENNFKVTDIVDFKIEGDYLVGTLPHLSAYALVGNSVPTKAETTTVSTNPKTGDNIITVISIFIVASIISLTIIKKRRE